SRSEKMISIFAILLLALPLIYFLQSCWCLRQNIAAAKATGLPYVVLPWDSVNLPWLMIRPILLPYIQLLPIRDKLWFKLLSVDWPWNEQYTIFHRLGWDNFISVSPVKVYFNTADAAVIDQITNKRTEFPKPVEAYDAINLYGKNVVSTEGNLWKYHRKTVSPPFNEKNNRLVWLESLRQAQAMVSGWMGNESKASSTVHTVAADAMRLSLHVISCAGFGVNLNWPSSEGQSPQKAVSGSISPMPENTTKESQFGPDHNMSYTEALSTLLHSMVWILVLPMYLLKILPLKGPKTAYSAYIEWGKYLRELLHNKKNAITTGQDQAEGDGMDLMGFLLRAANVTPNTSSFPSEKTSTSSSKQQAPFSEADIMGNAFVFLLAGHETAANSIHFSLIYLAMNPRSQRRLQASLDRIFGSRPISAWDYERDFTALFSGFAGAVLAEELRLIPPVASIPKCVLRDGPPQPLLINEKQYHIPPATSINLISTAAHRNPHVWPAGKPREHDGPVHPTSNTDNDLEEFKPERWLRDTPSAPSTSDDTEHAAPPEDAPSTSTGTSSSSAHYRPPRGAYIPFSEGYRACMGRRFAQAEVLAVLAVIFRTCSVELNVDAYASEEEVARMGEEERRKVWGMAKRDVEK
ncbi:MAG: hypothetical protein Q9177_006439, partial [Variospora cf. flavescens]